MLKKYEYIFFISYCLDRYSYRQTQVTELIPSNFSNLALADWIDNKIKIRLYASVH